MCGISGIVNRDNSSVSKSDIKRMNDLIAHRGPDSEGYFLESNLALAHRRLSILDLSSDGNQPMHFNGKNGEYVIVYNGEIYNYIELRDELKKEGYEFKSNTDTEVILASYDYWGDSCIEKFNGMWAFAIFDKVKNILFCSRDRFGIKPFYYAIYENRFIFGSEIKQILAFVKERFANRDIVLEYLVYGLEEHTDETFFDGIKKLDASHNLIYNLNNHNFKIERYFEVKIKDLSNLSQEEAAKLIYNNIKDSINLRLRSDVKVGSCLSGGLDSSTIAAIAAKEYAKGSNQKFCAIHAKSIEAKTDESLYAKLVAKEANLDLHITKPNIDDISNSLDEVIYTQEEPFGGLSILMQYFVMRKAKEIGCTVMLDGQGGDETLFGYESYFGYYFASLLKRLRVIKYIEELKRLNTFKLSKKRIVIDSILRLFKKSIYPIEGAIRAKRLGLKADINYSRIKDIFEFKDFKSFQIEEITKTHLKALLKYEDKNSMAHSIESRLPLLDYHFVIDAISLDDRLKFKDGYLKYILRVAIKDILPKEVVFRREKFGFEAPTHTWIEKNREFMMQKINNSNILNEILDIKNLKITNEWIFWRLFNIALWEEKFDIKGLK